MKVYVVFYDFEGYEPYAGAIFETLEEAKKYLKKEYGDSIEHCIVEWNTKNQERKKIEED